MNVDTIVSDVKGAVEPYVAKSQDVVTLSVETVKQANSVVISGVQDLFKTNVGVSKELFSAAQSSFDKARADGVKQVASKPIEYVPVGKELFVGAYKDSYAIVTKAGEELVTIVRKGFDDVVAHFSGSKTVSGEMKKAKSTVNKTATKAKKTVRKAAKKATA